jgi:hypothetical protein
MHHSTQENRALIVAVHQPLRIITGLTFDLNQLHSHSSAVRNRCCYIARTAQAYRRASDDIKVDKGSLSIEIKNTLKMVKK